MTNRRTSEVYDMVGGFAPVSENRRGKYNRITVLDAQAIQAALVERLVKLHRMRMLVSDQWNYHGYAFPEVGVEVRAFKADRRVEFHWASGVVTKAPGSDYYHKGWREKLAERIINGVLRKNEKLIASSAPSPSGGTVINPDGTSKPLRPHEYTATVQAMQAQADDDPEMMSPLYRTPDGLQPPTEFIPPIDGPEIPLSSSPAPAPGYTVDPDEDLGVEC